VGFCQHVLEHLAARYSGLDSRVEEAGMVPAYVAAGHAGLAPILGTRACRGVAADRFTVFSRSVWPCVLIWLTVAPSQDQPSQQQVLHMLVEYLIMDRFKFTSGKTERGDSRPFKLKLYNYYAQPIPEAVTYPKDWSAL